MSISQDLSLPWFLSDEFFRNRIYIRLSLVASFHRLAMETTMGYTTTGTNKQVQYEFIIP